MASDNNMNVIERKAFIFNRQKYNIYDGPGVRTVSYTHLDVYKRQVLSRVSARRSAGVSKARLAATRARLLTMKSRL